MRLRNRHFFPWVSAIGALAGSAAILRFVPSDSQLQLVLTWLAASAGFTAFLYTRHLQETQLFKQLFTEFNQRYNQMNEQLDRIRRREGAESLKPEQRALLIDYFNLCAEEYLFFRSGYIDAGVWKSWCSGMAYFAADPQIRLLWQEELKGESYYGFALDVISSTVSLDGRTYPGSAH